MDGSYDSIASMGEFRPMIVSPHKSPELKETDSGCRCECGCGCAGNSIINESRPLSDSETAIDTSGSEDDESRLGTSNDASHTDLRILSPHAVSQQAIVWLPDRSEELQLSESVADMRQIFKYPLLHDNDEVVVRGSPFGSSSAQKRNESDVSPRDLQTMSPGPGIGGWLQATPERTRVDHGQRVYILTPLRLSAEYQHARGKIVEHMLVPDEAFLVNLERYGIGSS